MFQSHPQKIGIVSVYTQKGVSLKNYPQQSGQGLGLPIYSTKSQVGFISYMGSPKPFLLCVNIHVITHTQVCVYVCVCHGNMRQYVCMYKYIHVRVLAEIMNYFIPLGRVIVLGEQLLSFEYCSTFHNIPR